jgi:hypothetical protein
MKLLLVAQNYHPFVGGVETHARQVAHALGKEHEVAVAALNFSANRLPPRVAMLHASVLAPRYASHDDGAVPVHSLTPGWGARLLMLPIAARVLPGLPRLAGYFRLESLGYRRACAGSWPEWVSSTHWRAIISVGRHRRRLKSADCRSSARRSSTRTSGATGPTTSPITGARTP